MNQRLECYIFFHNGGQMPFTWEPDIRPAGWYLYTGKGFHPVEIQHGEDETPEDVVADHNAQIWAWDREQGF